jgi:hypothetical protein
MPDGVIHDEAGLRSAVHWQPLGAATPIELVPPDAAIVTCAGLTE